MVELLLNLLWTDWLDWLDWLEEMEDFGVLGSVGNMTDARGVGSNLEEEGPLWGGQLME